MYSHSRNKVFISYSHHDKDWLDRIQTMLSPLVRKKEILLWDDTKIKPGSKWREEIEAALSSTKVAVLLVSKYFLKSDFIANHELPPILNAASKDGLVVIWIAVSYCLYEETEIVDYQSANDPAKPLEGLNQNERDRELKRICQEIKEAANYSTTKASQSYNNKSAESHDASRAALILSEKINHPPQKWWANIKGRFDYWKAKKMRTWLLDYYKNRDVGQHLQKVLEKGNLSFKIPYEVWQSRPAAITTQQIIVLISGPAGVGKTRFLNKLFREYLSEVELVVKIASVDIEVSLQRNDPQILWKEICNHFKNISPTGLSPLTPQAIAYALNGRKILFVIEDLHNVGSINTILPFLRRYFETYHRWYTHLNLLLTTREPNFNEAIGSDVNIVYLEPLKNYEPQDFFIKLCKDNGIELEISAVGEVLSKAFNTSMTKTPLFVVICAWLVTINKEIFEDVKSILQKEASQVYEMFINELFNRVSRKPDFELFKRVYEGIALELWPEAEGLNDGTIRNCLLQVEWNNSEPITLDFFEQNGFLFRSQEIYNIPRLAFPHQSMADYLDGVRKFIKWVPCLSLV